MTLPKEFDQDHADFLKLILEAHDRGFVGPYKPTPKAREFLKAWEDKKTREHKGEGGSND